MRLRQEWRQSLCPVCGLPPDAHEGTRAADWTAAMLTCHISEAVERAQEAQKVVDEKTTKKDRDPNRHRAWWPVRRPKKKPEVSRG